MKLLLGKEVSYIKGLFPHNLKQYRNLSLLYTHSLLLFSHTELNPEKPSWGWKVKNLAAGIEMLGMGCDFHLFDINNFGERNTRKREERYTLNLLFGDVFYSRAVDYLLSFGDSLVFEEVINSLKQVHRSRLLLHRQLLEVAANPALLKNVIEEKTALLLGINSLFKGTFLLSWSIFSAKETRSAIEQMGNLYKIFNYMTLIKSLQELNEFLHLMSGKLSVDMDLELVEGKKNSIRSKLDASLSGLETDWLKVKFPEVLDRVQGGV
ncbi:MAG: hypothetical protein ACQEP5_01275 [Actinomycetota bacterium]